MGLSVLLHLSVQASGRVANNNTLGTHALTDLVYPCSQLSSARGRRRWLKIQARRSVSPYHYKTGILETVKNIQLPNLHLPQRKTPKKRKMAWFLKLSPATRQIVYVNGYQGLYWRWGSHLVNRIPLNSVACIVFLEAVGLHLEKKIISSFFCILPWTAHLVIFTPRCWCNNKPCCCNIWTENTWE